MIQSFLSAITLCFCLWPGTAYLQNWNMEKNESGVAVYTRKVSGSSYKEYKGVVDIRSNMQRINNIIGDVARHPQWMHKTEGSRIVRKPSDSEVYSYSVNKAPWPASDRDNVVRYQWIWENPKSLLIKMSAAPTEVPEVSGKIRVKQLYGYWKLEDLGNGVVRVTQQVHAEPGGWVPGWLANSAVVDNPFNTLLGLKNWAEH